MLREFNPALAALVRPALRKPVISRSTLNAVRGYLLARQYRRNPVSTEGTEPADLTSGSLEHATSFVDMLR